jgi:hypothetical protein
MGVYTVVGSGDLIDFEDRVNAALNYGYILHGGMVVEQVTKWVEGMDGNEQELGSYYLQAMYKPPTTDEKNSIIMHAKEFALSLWADENDAFEPAWKQAVEIAEPQG